MERESLICRMMKWNIFGFVPNVKEPGFVIPMIGIKKMVETYLISDTHFGHANILKFVDEAGVRVRPEFASVEEMNERMIDIWNKNVRFDDKVYHLGDVCFGGIKTVREVMPRLNGKKRLILGNHDNVKGHELWKWFEKIDLWTNFTNHDFVITHLPFLPENFRKVKYNVHGHIHRNPDVSSVHLNISCEMTGYAPIHLDEVKKRLAAK